MTFDRMGRRRVLGAVMGLTLALPGSLLAQGIPLPRAVRGDSARLAQAMPAVARAVLAQYRGASRDDSLNTRFRLQLIAGDATDALETLAVLRRERHARDSVFAPTEYSQYELFARTYAQRAAAAPVYRAAVRRAFLAMDAPMSDGVAYRVAASFSFDLAAARAQLTEALASAPDTLSLMQAVALSRQYFVYDVYRRLLPVMAPVLREAEARRYAIVESAAVPLRDGATLTATIVRPRRLRGPQPAVLEYTIYADAENRRTALEMAAQGFVGVVATPRGKRASGGPIRPWETEAQDARDLLTWISRQPWSNGAVGMLGGSYAGFTQWAAAGTLHPALKTIVPAAAVAPGVDMPRENGVVLSFQYSWAHYVSNTRGLDTTSYRDGARWARLDSTWFARGAAYRALPAIDGVPNPTFSRWLEHPTFDAYWQRMMPSADRYAQISIPVLSITGYFDGAQPGAMHYLHAHLAARPSANHTLLIGPWDHFGSQGRPRPVLGDLRLDPVANVDIRALIYDWMRHVLRGAPRPALLADRVNFQVIGTNRWEHRPSLAAMSTDTLVLRLQPAARGDTDGRLTPGDGRDATAARDTAAVLQVDLADRTRTSGAFISVADDTTLTRTNGVVFTSAPLPAATIISGAFIADALLSVSARDVDLAWTLYERTTTGVYRQLSYHLGRASLARDPSRRELLTPGVPTRLPLRGARITSRTIGAGSQLVLVVQVNKNAESQVNYGTGKDVSDETINDATSPLRVTLFGATTLRIPLLKQ